MISADAPMIFDKGCDILITELTLRAWYVQCMNFNDSHEKGIEMPRVTHLSSR